MGIPLIVPGRAVEAWAVRLLRGVVLCGVGLYFVAYAALVFFRLQYPYELEWMEGAMVDHVQRVVAGELLYVRPTLDFVPFIYTPLYFYVAGAVAKLVGVGFLPLRLVSVACSLGSFVLLYLIVRRESGSRFAGVVAAGFFAATYRVTGAWFDIGRVDSLALFLMLAGVAFLRREASGRAQVMAAIALSLSFLTKQSGLLVIAMLSAYCVLANWRRAFVFVGTWFAIIGGSIWWLDRVHAGWFSYYIFQLPAAHETVPAKILGYWRDDTLFHFPVAAVVAVIFLLSRLRNPDALRFYGLLAAGMLGSSWVSRIHSGGWDNVLIPGCAALAILFGLGLPVVPGLAASKLRATQGAATVVLLLAVALQFGVLIYDPRHQLPTIADRRAGDSLVEMVGQTKGDVLVFYHGFVSAMAGKQAHAHWQAVHDVLRGAHDSVRAGLFADVQAAFQDRRFSAVILDSEGPLPDGLNIGAYYQLKSRVSAGRDMMRPSTGAPYSPEVVLVPR